MKRLLCFLALAFFGALCLAEVIPLTPALICGGILCLFGIGILFLRRFKARGAVSLLLIFFSVGLATKAVYADTVAQKTQPFYGAEARICGTLCDFPEYSYGKGVYLLSDVTLDSVPVPGKVRLTSSEQLEAEMDDQIEADVAVFAPAGSENYLMARRIFLKASVRYTSETLVTPCEHHSLLYYPRLVREWIKTALCRFTPKEEGALLGAILTGDKSNLSRKTLLDFQNLGLSHMLAVSGLHLSVFVGFFSLIFRKLGIGRKARCIFLLLFSLAFAAVTGFTPSIVRSTVMLSMILIGQLLRRESDSITSLAAAVLVISLLNPYAPHDVGFLLSACATFGILSFEGRMEARLRAILHADSIPIRPLRSLLQAAIAAFSCSFCATAAVLPVSLYFFGRISLIGPFANLIFFLPLALMLLLGILIALLMPVPFLEPAVRVLSFLAAACGRVFLYLGGALSDLGATGVSVDSVYLSVWAIFSAAAVLLVLFLKDRRVRLSLLALCVALFFGANALQRAQREGRVELTVLSAGNETSVLVRDGEELLVIGTAGYTLDSALSARAGAQLCGAVILNAAYRDYEGALTLAEEFGAKAILYPQELYLNGFTEQKLAPYAGETLATKHVSLTYVPPQKRIGGAVRLTIGDTQILICGKKVRLSGEEAADYLIVSSKVEGAPSAQHLILTCYADQAAALAQEYSGGYQSLAASSEKEFVISFKTEP